MISKIKTNRKQPFSSSEYWLYENEVVYHTNIFCLNLWLPHRQ